MTDRLPTGAKLHDDSTLAITWSDHTTQLYPLDLLRAKCPCAECVDEWTGQVRVERTMFEDIRLKRLEEVGAYAFRFTFSDGHDLGLYTWKSLRVLGTPLEHREGSVD